MKDDTLIFVLTNKLNNEIKYPYSIVSKEVFNKIPQSAIYKTKEVPNECYTKAQLEIMRDLLS